MRAHSASGGTVPQSGLIVPAWHMPLIAFLQVRTNGGFLSFSRAIVLFSTGMGFAFFNTEVVGVSICFRLTGRGVHGWADRTHLRQKRGNSAMSVSTTRRTPRRRFASLQAKDLMSPNPVSIQRDATVREAVALLTDRGFGAAPVIDEAGRPVGVISRTDILIHEREHTHRTCTRDNTDWDLFPEPSWPDGFSIEVTDPTTVAEIMTPVIFSVPQEASAREVVKRMRELKVHHLFVIDGDVALVGIISPLDVLRHLEE